MGIISLASAQVAGYSFNQASSTFDTLTVGNALTPSTSATGFYYVDSTVVAGSATTTSGIGLPIGFTFKYNGSDFDLFGINANGWISFGQTLLAPNSVNMNSSASNTPISSTSTASAELQNRVCAFGRNLAGQTNSKLTYATIGTAPDRILVVEWIRYRRSASSTGENMNFQIRIHETTNIIEFVYGTITYTGTGSTIQVGLRGQSNADYFNRTSTSDWSATTAGTVNNAAITLTSAIFPTSGLTYVFTPPSAVDAGITIINSPAAIITGGLQDVAVTIKNFGTDTLFDADIAWSVNGVPQTSFSWSDTLIYGASEGPDTIGTYTFTLEGNNTVKAWTENPNGNADGNNANDTTTFTVYLVPANDIAVIDWILPVSGCGHTASDSVTIQVTNAGTDAQDTIPVYYSINGGQTYAGPDTIIGPVNPGDTVTFTFTELADFSAINTYDCIAIADNSDANQANDSVFSVVTTLGEYSGNPFVDSLETGNNYYTLADGTNSSVTIENGVGYLTTNGFHMTGGAQGTWPSGSSSSTTPAQAFSYSDHVATIDVCSVDPSAYSSNLYLSFDLKQTHSQNTGNKYCYFAVVANGSDTLTAVDGTKYFNATTTTSDPFTKRVFDLSAYLGLGTDFALKFISSCKYDDATYGGTADNVYIDNIALSEAPDVDLGPDTAFCPGGTITLYAGSPAPGYNYYYLWTTTLNPSPFANIEVITVDSTATYIAQVDNGYGVTDIDTVVVGNYTLPVVSLGSDPTNCTSVILDPGAGYASYYWSTTETTQFITVTATGFYWVDVTNSNGCVGRDSVFVTILPSPTVNAGPDLSVCYLDTLFILSATASDYDSLLWTSNGDGHFNDSTLLNPYYMLGTTDISNGTVDLTLTGYNNCDTISDVAVITVTTSATADAGIDETICLGESVQLSATGGTVYAWSPTTGLSDPNIANPDASPAVTTTYTVTVTSSCGSATDDVTVTVNSTTPPDLGNDTAFCDGNSVAFDAGIYDSYSWNTGETTQTIIVNTSGTYIVTVTGSNTCTAIDSVQVTVHPLPVVHLSNDTSFCGTQLTIIADSGYANYLWNGAIAGTYQYVATVSGDYFVNVTDSLGCSNNSDTMHLELNLSYDQTNNPDICQGQSYYAGGAFQTTTGTYYDSLLTINGCDSIVTTYLTVHPLPFVDLPDDDSLCSSQFVFNAGTGYVDYLWNDTIVGTNLYTTTTSGDYFVYVTDSFGCSNYSDTTHLEFYTIPPVDLPDTSISINTGSVLLDAGTGYDSYYWSNGETTHLIVVFGNYLGLGTHYIYVTVTTADGCTAIGEAIITVFNDAGITQYDNASINVYPNPANNLLFIDGLTGSGEANVLISDELGRTVISSINENNKTPYSIDVSALSPGMYTIRLISDNILATRKFIKQ